jgi:glyoxylase-like metal-dependent hydrolase (beta-lactamase superfamily II)
MIIGDYKISVIRTGNFRLDGGAMFGVVPKPLWSRTNPADEQNRIQMCVNSLLLESSTRKILIDTGVGDKMAKKLNEIYAVDYTEHSLLNSLKQAGVDPESITDVILTHLHFDHCGGSTYYHNGELKIRFPNAIHYVQKKHYEWALNPTERDKASFLPQNFVPLEESKLLNQVDGELKFDDFITLIPVNGHTRNMQVIKISDDKTTIFYATDLIPMSSHIPLPYIMGYDLFPLITLEEKRAFLSEAALNNWIIFFEHDPLIKAGRVSLNDKGFYIVEKLTIDK